MAGSPVPILALVILTLTFEGAVFGGQIAESRFPTFEEPARDGFFGVVDSLTAVVQAVWGVVLFLVDLITFNVPGAPWYVRTTIGGTIGTALIWSIAGLIRGN